MQLALVTAQDKSVAFKTLFYVHSIVGSFRISPLME